MKRLLAVSIVTGKQFEDIRRLRDGRVLISTLFLPYGNELSKTIDTYRAGYLRQDTAVCNCLLEMAQVNIVITCPTPIRISLNYSAIVTLV